MEEIEKRKVSKNNKIMTAISAPTIRVLIKKANELNIKRDDILSIFKEADQVVLIYFK